MEEGEESDGQVSQVATCIQDLPDECLVEILSRVGDTCRPNPSQKLYMVVHHPLQCASVCKHWKSKVDSAVLTLCLSPVRFTHDLARHIGSRFPHLRTLTFDQTFQPYVNGGPLLPLALLTRNLEHLKAHFDHDKRFASDAIAQALAKWTLLRHLDIRTDLCGDVTLDALRQMSNLQHLALDCCSSGYFPWLCPRLGDSLTMPLTRLELSCPNVIPALPPHLSKVLKRLEVRGFQERRLPDSFGALLFPELETLRLSYTRELVELPDSIGSLSRTLTSLDLHDCDQVGALPRAVGQLANLRELRVTSCRLLDTWHNLGGLRALRSLTIHGCWTPPGSLGQLTSLRHLSLQGVARVPEDVGDLLGLETLHVESYNFPRLPSSIVRLSSLQDLHLVLSSANFGFLLSQVGDLTALRRLKLCRCGTGKLPDEVYESLGRLSNLEIFEIGMLTHLRRLPDVKRWGALTKLEITSCWGLEALPEEIGVWLGATLRELHLEDCSRLVSLPGSVGELRCLELLLVARCKRLERLPESVGALTALRVLVVRDCKALVSLPTSLQQLSGLRIEHSCQDG